ncbi:MAG: DUF58 domain-containing protein [Gammaproteobacteria bacterium]|nr:DUF58 domain-containing protein [Gammaproteobacteria bacterium]MDH5630816.1 DUF58 domain-containing protein [Gammaproteobacteria bacterium]
MKISKRGIFLLVIWMSIALIDTGLRLNYFLETQESNVYLSQKIWIGSGLMLLVFFIFEWMSLRQFRDIEVRRKIALTLPVNSYIDVVLDIKNPTSRLARFEVIDHVPDFCKTKNLNQFAKLSSREEIEIKYQLKALERGGLQMDTCELWVESFFGLMVKRFKFECKSFSKIYPNYRALQNYLLLAMEQQTQQLGIRLRQQRGDGLEFHQLREYRQGDTLRQIDWRASSRTGKMISKEYQQERDQNVIFLLDSGRRMRTKDGMLSHFDQALNAVLLLSSIALRQGDAVGLSIFGGKDLFLLPQKGPSAINAMLNQVYDLQPTNRASDLVTAVGNLTAQFKKRSLVIIVSNVRAEDEEEVNMAVSLLRRHHLVMLANLKEQVLVDTLDGEILQLDDALKYAQTINYLRQRELLHSRLSHQGVIAMDSVPKHLSVGLVNQYFEIKRSGRL